MSDKTEAAPASAAEGKKNTRPKPAGSAKAKRARRPPLTPDQWREFITTWQASATLEDVTAKLSIDADTARSRAATARSKGVNLKEFVKVDWADLAKLVEPAPAPAPQ